jgi:hypothetical protein
MRTETGIERSPSGTYLVSIVPRKNGEHLLTIKRVPETTANLPEEEFLDFICEVLNE